MGIDWAIDRLRELRCEYENGEQQVRECDELRLQLKESMLRISGAIHVLEELIEESDAFSERLCDEAQITVN